MNMQTKLQAATANNAQTETRAKSFTRKNEKAKQKAAANNKIAQVFAEHKTTKKQAQAIEELLTFTTTEESNEALQQYEEFCALLQKERQELALQVIKATDKEVFANLQMALGDINNKVLDFKEAIKPFIDILNAVGRIQDAGSTLDMVDAKRQQERLQEEWNKEIKSLTAKINDLDIKKKNNDQDIHIALNSNGFFENIFGTSKGKLEKADRLKESNKGINTEKELLQAKIKEVQSQKAEAPDFGDLNDDLEVFMGLLDLTADETQDRMQKIIEDSVEFIETTGASTEQTIDKVKGMRDQVKMLNNSAFTIRQKYAVLSEATSNARDRNAKMHEDAMGEYEKAKEDGDLEAMELERQVMSLSENVDTLTTTNTETNKVLAGLEMESQRIQSMDQSTKTMMTDLNRISTASIAEVGSQVATTLTGVSVTATQQAATAAEQGLAEMSKTTMEINESQVINQAAYQQQQVSNMVETLNRMSSSMDMVGAIQESSAAVVEQTLEMTEEMRSMADEHKEAMQALQSVAADAVNDK